MAAALVVDVVDDVVVGSVGGGAVGAFTVVVFDSVVVTCTFEAFASVAPEAVDFESAHSLNAFGSKCP